LRLDTKIAVGLYKEKKKRKEIKLCSSKWRRGKSLYRGGERGHWKE